jgi:hypothetical protein
MGGSLRAEQCAVGSTFERLTDLPGKRPRALQQPRKTFTAQAGRQTSADLLVVGVQPSDFVLA